VKKNIKIEFLIVTKNDDYTKDYLYRIEHSLNFYIESILNIRKSKNFQFTVIDWFSENKICNNIKLNKGNDDIVKFYKPSKAIFNKFSVQSHIPDSFAFNLRIANSKSDFIFILSPTVLLEEYALLNLYNLCLGKNKFESSKIRKGLILIERKLIPWRFFIAQPDISSTKEFIHKCSHKWYSDSFLCSRGDGAGLIGASLETWKELDGLDERLDGGYGGNDTEVFIRASQTREIIHTACRGIMSFKIEHSPLTSHNAGKSQLKSKRYINFCDLKERHHKNLKSVSKNGLILEKYTRKRIYKKHKSIADLDTYRKLYSLERFQDKIRHIKNHCNINNIPRNNLESYFLLFKCSTLINTGSVHISSLRNITPLLIATSFFFTHKISTNVKLKYNNHKLDFYQFEKFINSHTGFQGHISYQTSQNINKLNFYFKSLDSKLLFFDDYYDSDFLLGFLKIIPNNEVIILQNANESITDYFRNKELKFIFFKHGTCIAYNEKKYTIPRPTSVEYFMKSTSIL
jgi:hypothetical protein